MTRLRGFLNARTLSLSFRQSPGRSFHSTPRHCVVRPFLLADIGEGIREVQIIQWFVKPGARVEQFDPLCEVQSDKAAVEITSRFDGIIKKLHYEADDTAFVGKPLVDIDIQSEVKPEDETIIARPEDSEGNAASPSEQLTRSEAEDKSLETTEMDQQSNEKRRDRIATLATPAVRHLSKEFNVDIANIRGTGRDGRVLKADVQKYHQDSQSNITSQPSPAPSTFTGDDRTVPLTPVQNGMFKTMTRSLSIPHFMYSTTVDTLSLNNLRRTLNRKMARSHPADTPDNITLLPFILKAISLAFLEYPILNSSLDTSDSSKPQITYRAIHDFGIAVDTPSGLLVPVVRNIQSRTVQSLATEISRVSELARSEKLSAADLTGATFAVSNIGSIGGGVVAPVIVPPQVAIVGVGRTRVVPGFDENGNVVKKEEAVLSWSADHRIVDGATAAKCAERVKMFLEDPGMMMANMR